MEISGLYNKDCLENRIMNIPKIRGLHLLDCEQNANRDNSR